MLEIIPLAVTTDARGDACTLPGRLFTFLRNIREMHTVTINPGMVRGNHCHLQRNEALLVSYQDKWTLAWQESNQQRMEKQFDSSGMVLLLVPAGVLHALKNTGTKIIDLVSCSDMATTATDDTHWQKILE